MDAFKKTSKSGFPPYFENTMQDMVSGTPTDDSGVSLKHQWMRGPQDHFKGDTVADLNKSQLADLSSIRQFGIGQTRPGSTLGQAASQLGTVMDASGNLSDTALSSAGIDRGLAAAQAAQAGGYGTGLMDYGRGATQSGLSQQQYAGYTPFQGQQLESMLAGDVDTSGLQDVYDVMAKQASQALSPQLAAIRRQMPGGGAAGTNTRTGLEYKEAMESGLHEKLADAWAPMAWAAKTQAEGRRLDAGKLALEAQLAAQSMGVKGAELGLDAGRLNVAGGQLMQEGIRGATGARQLGLNAAQQAAGITAAQMGGLQSALQTGNIRQGQQQAEITADVDRWNYNQNKDMMFTRNMLDMMGSARIPTIQTASPSLGSTLMNMRPLFGLGQYNQSTTPALSNQQDVTTDPQALAMRQRYMNELYPSVNYMNEHDFGNVNNPLQGGGVQYYPRNINNPQTWRTYTRSIE